MKEKCSYGFLFIFINTMILGIIAGISHFTYEFCGNSVIIGLFNPVNESVWEHLKFMFFPNLLWWILVYFIQRNKCDIDPHKWIIAAATSLITAPLSVILLFYSYTGVTGKESVIVDILLTFICYFIALSSAFHIYKYIKPSKFKVITSMILIIIIFASFIVFTFKPPQIPLFYDKTTQTYGIQT